MQSERVLRFEVAGHEELSRIASAPLPNGWQDVGSDLDMFRVIYFDTSSGDLARKGATVRLCIRPNETQLLAVDIGQMGSGYEQPRRHVEAEVPALPAAMLFAGDSEPARMVSAMIDPTHLRPALELETMRRLRTVVASTGDRTERITLAFDAVTVRRGDVSGDLYELEVTIPGGEAGRYPGLVEVIEAAYGVRLTLTETLARGRALLEQLQLQRIEQQVRGAREVAVVAHSNGRVALCRDGSMLRIPAGSGSGQDACRRVLRSVFGRAQARIRLLGTSAGDDARPALEVWLAEGAEANEGECTWLPVEVLLERVGSPELRDARTLTALHAVARSNIAAGTARSENGVATERDPDEPAYPLFKQAISAAKLSALLEAKPPQDLAPELLLNPELSRLAFDERILVIAEDETVPLLERVKFLSMFGTRIDDFFMTRIAEFKKQVATGSDELSIDGMTPSTLLDATRIRARQISARAYRLWTGTLLPQLKAEGIRILRWDDLTDADRDNLRKNYARQAAGVITPIVADPTHPFPHLRNLRPAIAAMLRLSESSGEHFVAIELPGGLPRFVPVSDTAFVPLEEIILASLPDLYPGLSVIEATTFRVTRSAVIDLEEEPAGGVLAAIEEEIARRPFGEVVRLEVEARTSPALRERLLRELQFELPDVVTPLSEDDVYPSERVVDLASLKEIAAVEMPQHHYEETEHTSPIEPDRPILDQIAERDILVHFPDDRFEDTVERFLAEAADDPDVVAIKITLYRTNAQSRLVQALARARSAGKDAFALIELKASFDERRNIEWARSLEQAGIHVVFSPAKIKVHAKIALVVRREGDGLRRYVYIGTGNLNAATARGYTDVGVLTAHPELAEEINTVFNVLTGYSASRSFEHLLVSPFTMRDRFVELIEREIEHARAGRGGRIRIQMNGLADRRMIAALYRASCAGVEIDMAVREICCLRPGIPGLSENIRVVSVLGRFLQHSRIYCFHNAGSPEYFFGSADWRPRNLSKRVEVITPIYALEHQAALNDLIEGVLRNPTAWQLRSDGAYVRGDAVIGG